MKLRISDRVGNSAITREEGQEVFDWIRDAIAQGAVAELDFEGVTVFATPFFNAAVGQLLASFSSEDLNRHLRVHNLTGTGPKTMIRAIENAKRYFGKSEEERRSHDARVDRLLEDM